MEPKQKKLLVIISSLLAVVGIIILVVFVSGKGSLLKGDLGFKSDVEKVTIENPYAGEETTVTFEFTLPDARIDGGEIDIDFPPGLADSKFDASKADIYNCELVPGTLHGSVSPSWESIVVDNLPVIEQRGRHEKCSFVYVKNPPQAGDYAGFRLNIKSYDLPAYTGTPQPPPPGGYNLKSVKIIDYPPVTILNRPPPEPVVTYDTKTVYDSNTTNFTMKKEPVITPTPDPTPAPVPAPTPDPGPLPAPGPIHRSSPREVFGEPKDAITDKPTPYGFCAGVNDVLQSDKELCDAVTFVIDHNLMKTDYKSLFYPTTTVTRGDLAKLFYAYYLMTTKTPVPKKK